MLRKILSVVIGVIAGAIVVAIGEMLGHMIYPPPPGMEMTDPAVIREYIMTAPFGALFLVIIAWSMGSFAAGVFSSLIMKGSGPVYAFICGGIMLAVSIFNMVMMPHPAWFWVLGVLVHLPFAWLGYRLVKSK